MISDILLDFPVRFCRSAGQCWRAIFMINASWWEKQHLMRIASFERRPPDLSEMFCAMPKLWPSFFFLRMQPEAVVYLSVRGPTPLGMSGGWLAFNGLITYTRF